MGGAHKNLADGLLNEHAMVYFQDAIVGCTKDDCSQQYVDSALVPQDCNEAIHITIAGIHIEVRFLSKRSF
jgi:hypothetical protein